MPRHHLVPQMYLRRFADDRSVVLAVPRDERDRQVPTTVRKAAAEVGFYAMPTDDLQEHVRDGHDPEVAESALARVEGACATHIDAIVRGELPPATSTARLHLSVFIALQITRGRRFRQDFADLARLTAPAFIRQNVTPERIRQWLVETDQPTDAEDVEAFMDRLAGPNGPKPVVRQAMYVQHAFQNAMEVIAPTIVVRRWRLLTFSEPCLLTSDEPVAVPVIEGRGAANVPQLWLPLDRSHALELALQGAEGVVHAPLAKARKINALVATQALQWIFHHPDDTPLNGLTVAARTGLVQEVEDLVDNGEVVGEVRRVVRRPVT